MKRVWLVAVGGAFGLITLVNSTIAHIPPRYAGADELSIWAGNITLTNDEPVDSAQNRGNTICERAQVKKRQLTGFEAALTVGEQIQEAKARGWEVQSNPLDGCIVQSSNGLFDVVNKLWSESGNPNNMLSVKLPVNGNVDPAPASGLVLVRTNVSSAGYHLSVNHNFRGIGDLAIEYEGGSPYDIEWRVRAIAELLRYDDGSSVGVRSHAFSANGRYLVAHLTNNYLVRIDLRTNELVPVYYRTQSFEDLSVSSDGDYILSYRSGSLLLHDLTDCQNSFAEGLWSRTMSADGCTNRNLYFDILGAQPQVGGGFIGRLRFGLNSASLTVDGGWREDGSSTWRRFTFEPENYTPSVEGYLAMGDSFSSGEGDTEGGVWYEPGTDEQGDIDTFAGRNLCHLSRRSYPYLLAIELGYLANNTQSPPADGLFHSVACSGAKIHNVVGLIGEKQDDGTALDFSITDNQYRYNDELFLKEWQPGATSQTGFIVGKDNNVVDRNEYFPEYITLGIGGNNAGFGTKLLSCLGLGICDFATDVDRRSQVAIEIAGEKLSLQNAYRDIKALAPDTKIYVVGYPQFVQQSDGLCGENVHLEGEEITFIRNSVDYMNSVIEAAAKEAGVVYVDVSDILDSTNLCSGAPDSEVSVNGVTAGDDIRAVQLEVLSLGICKIRSGCIGNETFHPNQNAQAKYRDRILNVTQNFTIDNPISEPTDIPLPASYFGTDAQLYVNNSNGSYLDQSGIEQLTQFIIDAGSYKSPVVDLGSLLPDSTVEIEIRSTPRSLGSFQANESGELRVEIQLPEDLEGGYHEIHLTALNQFGEHVKLYEPIFVAHSETDFDGDGIDDEVDQCLGISDSNTDVDRDGIDDACDPHIAASDEEPQLTPCEKYERILQKIAEKDKPISYGLKLRKNIKRLRCKVWVIKQQETISQKERRKVQRLREKVDLYRGLLQEYRDVR